MMLLKKRSLRVKRLALGIVAADIICAIMQAFNIAELAPVDHAIAVHIFWILLIRVALIVGVCFLVVWMLTTGTMKHGIEEGKNGLPTK
jgi:phosphotransferase system  glucose/maltose/N-acetylglucosamine-specific IIC component